MLSARTIFVCLIAFASFFSGHASAANPKPDNVIHLQLRWHHQFQFAGYYAALEKGFYKEEGLDVRLHAGDPQHQPVPEVLAGHAQYAEDNSEVLFRRLQGKPLVALAAIFQHSPSVLLTRLDSQINSVHDLVGKRVMLTDKTEDADFLVMLKNEGIGLSQLKVISSSYRIQDLIDGKVDAINSYLTNEPYYLQQHGVTYNVITPSNYRIDFYSDIFFTTEAEVRSNPQRVEAMRRATLKGWRYAMDNQEEIIDLLINKYHVEKTRDHLQFEAAEMRKLILPDLVEIGHMNPARWQHMADTFVQSGLVDSDENLEGFIYNSNPKSLPGWFLYASIVIGVFLAIISFIAAYLFRINRQLAQAKDDLWRTEERSRLALTASRQGWFDLRVDTGDIIVSSEYAKMLGFDPATFKGSVQEWQNNVHPDDRAAVIAGFRDCLIKHAPVSMDYRRLKKDGSWIWLNTVGQVIEWSPQQQALRIIGIHTDISERKALEIELLRQAHIDFLTGVSNRGYFMERAEQELNRALRYDKPLSLIMLDIDFFKQINDSYGHKAGDLVLKKLAEVSLNTLREVDLLGRLGGEEFAVLLPETEKSQAIEVAERLREALSQAKVLLDRGGLPIRFTVSMGVSSLDSKDSNIDVLLNLADKGLYTAKENGRNKVCVVDV